MATKVGCPACGKTIDVGQSPCPRCGVPLDVHGAGAPVIADDTWGAKYCSQCGTVARPVTRTRGSAGIEVLLWLLMILPGVLYTAWRRASVAHVCPGCGAPNMWPLESPKAKAALAQTGATS